MTAETASTHALTAEVLPVLSLSDLPVAVPGYDRGSLRPAIVHIGVGGFHRAHLATYVDDLCRQGTTGWAIVGAGVLASDAAMNEALSAQDFLYTVISRGPTGTDVQVIGSIVDFVHAYPDPDPLITLIAAPSTQIVSLTVTEGGYPVDANGAYDASSPNAGPGGAFSAIVAGLVRRRDAGAGPLTVMSCDNIMVNGAVTAAAVTGEAAAVDPSLNEWIEANVGFPNSMVDRITPATTDTDRQWLRGQVGIDDRWPVITEPFRQWVVEDRFRGERLPLEALDVIITDNIEPYEFMKLRLLNAGHSCLAYLAALLDIELVDEAMADPDLLAFLKAFLNREARTVLPPIEGIDINAYVGSLLERFANPNIGDQIARLCLDGTAKFPKFLIPTIERQIAVDGPVTLSALALAGWCQYLLGSTWSGTELQVASDPALTEAQDYARRSVENPTAFLDLAAVFPGTVVGSPVFAAAFEQHLQTLRTRGPVEAIRSAIAEANHP